MRTLTLTSPPIHGDQVRTLQHQINNRLAGRGGVDGFGGLLSYDGDFGTETYEAMRKAAWVLGIGGHHLSHFTGYVQGLIAHPARRNPVQLARAKKRKPKAPTGPAAVVKWLRSQVGVTEHPANSNWGTPVEDWLKFWKIGPAPWCLAFAGYALKHVGGVMVTQRVVFAPYVESDARNRVNGFRGFSTNWADREPGDIVLWCFEGTEPTHGEIYVGDEDDIGGNTSIDASGSQSNGGAVAIKVTGQGARPMSDFVGLAKPRW